ncbi:MAG: hypothetical protein PW788_08275 [Micavibrio sp.]|nr:hypothetical protein [Micavibrio sp.]
MMWLHDIAYFFGGMFFINSVPHLVRGVMGMPFQSPFATPPGEGLSSARVNVLWGFFNLLLAYVLLCRVGAFDVRAADNAAAFGAGMLLLGLFCAHHFGKFHGGRLKG